MKYLLLIAILMSLWAMIYLRLQAQSDAFVLVDQDMVFKNASNEVRFIIKKDGTLQWYNLSQGQTPAQVFVNPSYPFTLMTDLDQIRSWGGFFASPGQDPPGPYNGFGVHVANQFYSFLYSDGENNVYLHQSLGGDLFLGPGWDKRRIQVDRQGYFALRYSSLGSPPSADCNSDNQRGRIIIDKLQNRLYICNGAVRGWDFIVLND